jgi:hypothetical protein
VAINYQALADEITNNPKGITDLGWHQIDRWIRDTLNTPGISGETIQDTSNVDMNLIMAEMVKTEIDALNTNRTVLLSGLITRDGVNPTSGLNIIRSIFVAGTTTRTNLESLINRPASRSEILFGEPVTLIAMNKARRLL